MNYLFIIFERSIFFIEKLHKKSLMKLNQSHRKNISLILWLFWKFVHATLLSRSIFSSPLNAPTFYENIKNVWGGKQKYICPNILKYLSEFFSFWKCIHISLLYFCHLSFFTKFPINISRGHVLPAYP